MAHPFFDAIAFPWPREDAKELYAVLVRMITTANEINLVYQQSGAELLPLALGQPPNLIWKEALDNVARAGAMEQLCDVLLAQAQYASNKRYREAIEAVKTATPTVRLQFVPNGAVVLDRVELRNKLENLESDGSPLRVVLVRGGPQSGKSQGRFLFETSAKERGAKVVYLFEGIVATVDDVVMQLFGALGALSRIPDRGSTTRDAWYRAVCIALQEVAFEKQQPLWIAIDDLGPGPDTPPAPLLDPEIREFCEQFALNMANPAFGQWFRLMLIHYPDGDVPTKWKHEIWSEDRTSETDVQEAHVAEYLRSWASHHGRQILDDEVAALAADIVAKANAPPVPGAVPLPRLRRLHDTLTQAVRDLEQRSP